MKKLALVGKNIEHSRSPEMYRKLISKDIQYDLLDYENPSQIPSVNELFLKYDGINITSPYKQHFLNEIELTENAKKLLAVNCLKKIGSKVYGENTDFLAIMAILTNWQKKYQDLHIILLGDGVMSKITKLALDSLQISHKNFSRKFTHNFNQLKIPLIFETEFSGNGQRIVINTCARDYIFKGELNKSILFWDYNYNFSQHSSTLPSQCLEYVDGLEMLELQAALAVSFWST